jgi:hypothetical protein
VDTNAVDAPAALIRYSGPKCLPILQRPLDPLGVEDQISHVGIQRCTSDALSLLVAVSISASEQRFTCSARRSAARLPSGFVGPEERTALELLAPYPGPPP